MAPWVLANRHAGLRLAAVALTARGRPEERGHGLDGRIVEEAELMIKVATEPGTVILELYGELDLASAGALERELHRAEQEVASGTVIVDLGALSFADSTGLNMLVAADRRAAEGPWSLEFLRPGGAPSRLFDLTGLAHSLSFLD
jgi:anti-anti-sigma factor